MRKHLILAGLLFFTFCSAGFSSTTSSFFTVKWKDGKAWLLSPTGNQFLSMGVNAIGDQSYRAPNDHYYNPVKNQFNGNKKAWISEVFNRLKKWKFNSIGCWADEDLLGQKFPFTYMLYIARSNPWDKVLDGVFGEEFEKAVTENAQKAAKFKDDQDLIGYFLDNEMPWWGDFGWKTEGQRTLLEKYAAIPVEDANKRALGKFFESRYSKNVEDFNKIWGTKFHSFEEFDGPITLTVKTKKQKSDANAWAGVVAERYFSVTTKAIHEVDPNHLILGVRFAGETPWEVVEACGHYCDVVSVNVYAKSGSADETFLNNFYAKSAKPILISEYSYSAMENQSGDPNLKGADVSVPTQKDRADHLDQFAKQLLSLPYIVGLHWFEWSDESPEGRFDGEAQNYGLVDIQDKEYRLVTKEHAQLNLSANKLHGDSTTALPAEFKSPGEADYRKAEPGMKVDPVRSFLKIDNTAHIDTWGDNGSGGKAGANTTTGVIVTDYETGTGWGCGESIFCNVKPLIDWGTADLRGYNLFTFQAFIPKGINFNVMMSESGEAAPNMATYTGLNGADGESYTFPSLEGTGHWETYKVNLSDLERRTVWGNQKGNNILDLQALHSVQFYLPGNQATGRMLIKDLQFRVK